MSACVPAEQAPPADRAATRQEMPIHPLLTAEGRLALDEITAARQTSDPWEILKHVILVEYAREEEDGTFTAGTAVESLPPEVTPSEGRPELLATAYERRIDDGVLNAAIQDPLGTLDLWVTLYRARWDSIRIVQDHVDVAMIVGTVTTDAEAEAFRRATIAEKTALGETATALLIDELITAGASIVETRAAASLVRILLPADQLDALAEVGFDRLALHTEPADDSAGWPPGTVAGATLDGVKVENLLQTGQFYAAGHFGVGRVAVVEGTGADLYRVHPGFTDASGNPRVFNCLGAQSNGTCTSNPNNDPAGGHSTATASLIVGDISLGQDPNIFNATQRFRRSGIARTARVVGLSSGGPWQEFTYNAVDPVDGSAIRVVNASFSLFESCEADVTGTPSWNLLYENGVSIFKSAGNNNNQPPCAVGAPAAAMGVFPIAAYVVNSNDEEAIDPDSSRGGTGSSWAEGASRSIIGAAAPSNYDVMAYARESVHCNLGYGPDWTTEPGCPNNYGNTSSAAPTAAGAAVLFRDWGLSFWGGLVNNPERLYASMLLFGDRFNGTTYLTSGFSNLWGAGAIRLRKFDPAGFDGPAAEHRRDHFCVPPGQDVIRPIWSGNAIPNSVDYIKVVTTWYDDRMEQGTPHDKLDLYVEKFDGTNWVVVASDTSDDSKQRVFLETENAPYRIRIYGRDVTNTTSNCGSPGIRVTHAVLVEDNARDDVDSNGVPTLSTIRPEVMP